jgi:two-component system alkaline phosphatase synthesis response regulator PhoP
MKHILIIEDDPDIRSLLELHLHDLELQTTSIDHGTKGYEKARSQNFDLIILDLMLPGMTGLEICQKLRALDVHTPILMLTAKAEEFDKVMGLESGADDYLTKPFGIREFLARVKAILRRTEQKVQDEVAPKTLSLGDLYIDLEKHQIKKGGSSLDLTPKEFDLLCLFAQNPGRSYSREQLLSQVWGYEFSGYEHTVNSHINRLRGKLEDDLDKPEYIQTVWGVGYRFNDEI